MKKIVISGVNGFIGSSLCKVLLERGYQVIGIGRNEFNHKEISKNKNFIFMKSTNIDNNILKNADIFYHLAWNLAVYNSRDNEKCCEIEIENIRLSYEMMKLAISAKIKKFIFCGSVTQDKYYFDKNRNLTDIKGSIYGIAKQTANDICQKMAIDAGMEYNHALLGNTYGPNDYTKKVVFFFIQKMIKNEDLKLVDKNDQADWVYIDDTVNALIAVGEKGKNMKTYYLGHRKISTFYDNIMLLKKVLNSKSKLEFGVFKESLGYDYSKVDLNSLFEDAGFECKADFEESFKKTIDWLLEEGLIEK